MRPNHADDRRRNDGTMLDPKVAERLHYLMVKIFRTVSEKFELCRYGVPLELHCIKLGAEGHSHGLEMQRALR